MIKIETPTWIKPEQNVKASNNDKVIDILIWWNLFLTVCVFILFIIK